MRQSVSLDGLTPWIPLYVELVLGSRPDSIQILKFTINHGDNIFWAAVKIGEAGGTG